MVHEKSRVQKFPKFLRTKNMRKIGVVIVRFYPSRQTVLS